MWNGADLQVNGICGKQHQWGEMLLPVCDAEADVNKVKLEARVGFEPTNGGFADLSLRPLGYRAGVKEYNETAIELSVPAQDKNIF
jgi:hypothetical protein